MANGDYKSTPLLYEFETIDHFIPEALKQVKILKSPPFTRDFVDLEAKFREVVQNLLGMDVSFQKLVGKVYDVGKRITVIVDDHTRPNVHTKILLSLLLNKLSACGVRDENIGILVATGTHREPTDEELEKIFGSSIYAQWSKNVVIHNCDENCRFIGETCQKNPNLH